jgi:hypothetical protein
LKPKLTGFAALMASSSDEEIEEIEEIEKEEEKEPEEETFPDRISCEKITALWVAGAQCALVLEDCI